MIYITILVKIIIGIVYKINILNYIKKFTKMIRILSITYKDSTAGGPYRVAIDHKN